MENLKHALLDKQQLHWKLADCDVNMLKFMRDNLSIILQERRRLHQHKITIETHHEELKAYAEIIIQDCIALSGPPLKKRPRKPRGLSK